MIKQYDVAKNDDFNLYLIEVNKYDIKPEIVSTDYGLMSLFTNCLNLDKLDNERNFLLALDHYRRLIGIVQIGLGDYQNNKMYARHIASALLLSGARQYITVHNHPDGALFLSENDKTNISFLKTMALFLEIEYVESYVVTKEGMISSLDDTPIYFEELIEQENEEY